MKIPDDNELDALVAACIALSDAIEDTGSDGVKAAYRLLLLELGRQIAKRGPTPNGSH